MEGGDGFGEKGEAGDVMGWGVDEDVWSVRHVRGGRKGAATVVSRHFSCGVGAISESFRSLV